MIDVTNVSASSRPYLPKAVRSLRIIGIEKKVSNSASHYDMLVLTMEICSPETETIDGKSVKIAGLQARDNIVFHGKNDIPLQQLRGLCAACKAPLQVDLDNAAFLKSHFLGKGIRAEVKTEPKPLMQVDDSGNAVPVMDDAGNPICDNNYRLGRVVGGDDRFTIAPETVPF
jgi:hypothetical protein